MCLAIPARVIELLPDEMARVSLDGVVVKRSVALVEDVAIGDYVVLHVGYALAKIDEDEAYAHAGAAARSGFARSRRMKHVDEYRDGELARDLARRIAAEARADRSYRFMEFCGGHTHAISRYGVEDLLPANIRMIHGPGCPVCVLPMGRIDDAITLAQAAGSDALHLWRSDARAGLERIEPAQGQGRGRRHPHGLFHARRHRDRANEPEREVVFFAIGFETTTPPTAMAIRLAQKKRLTNFTIFCNHVLTPSAIQKILEASDPRRRAKSTDSSGPRMSRPSSERRPTNASRPSFTSPSSSPASSRWTSCRRS